MPPKVAQKTKEAKLKAALSGGKGRKKKWSKGKVKEKQNASVLLRTQLTIASNFFLS